MGDNFHWFLALHMAQPVALFDVEDEDRFSRDISLGQNITKKCHFINNLITFLKCEPTHQLERHFRLVPLSSANGIKRLKAQLTPKDHSN